MQYQLTVNMHFLKSQQKMQKRFDRDSNLRPHALRFEVCRDVPTTLHKMFGYSFSIN